MTGPRPRKTRPPLSAEKLQEMALRYVERFATSRSKLASYLTRKIAERGWDDERQPDVDGLVERLSALGYVDDRSFAVAKARSLGSRGYGGRRVRLALHQAGIGEHDRVDAETQIETDKVDALLRYAKRRRVGPFAATTMDRPMKEKALAAMVRAGHDFTLARRLLDLAPGEDFDMASLGQP